MNWLKKVAATVCVAAMVVTMAACSSAGTTIPTTSEKSTVSTNTVQNEETVTYNNVTNGFAITYPTSWIAIDQANIETEEVTALFEGQDQWEQIKTNLLSSEVIWLDKEQLSSNITLTLQKNVNTKAEEMTSPAYQNQYESSVKSTAKESEILDKIVGKTYGDHYFLVLTLQSGKNKSCHAMTIDSNTMYVFALTTQEENYDQELPIFESMLSSLTFTK